MSSNQEITELKELLNKALQRLYENDMSLIERRANERAITFRFGVYLEELVKKSSFKELNVDAEYNRNGTSTKSTDSNPHGTYPDILLHQRETNDENKLVLEFKCYWNKEKCGCSDKIKLKEFTSESGEYRYNFTLGAFVNINKENFDVMYFINGKKEKDLAQKEDIK